MSQHEGHKEHILPLKVYLGIGALLFVMTGITVAVAQVDLGPLNLIVALAIAFFKASLVVLFFMHLYYDNKMFMLVFVSSLLFLALFISLTMFDTMRRGAFYEEVSKPIYEDAFIYTETMTDSTGAKTGVHEEDTSMVAVIR